MADDYLSMRRELEAKIIAKAWADPGFKAALFGDDPKAMLVEFAEAEGYDFSALDVDAITVNVVEDSLTQFTLVIPPNPADVELSDEAMDSVAGGSGHTACCN